MNLNVSNDKYSVKWYAHLAKALEAKFWCIDTFGDAWGDAHLGVPNNVGMAFHFFKFHRLNHANWFMLKYNSNFDSNSN